jgi:hypothetical protein
VDEHLSPPGLEWASFMLGTPDDSISVSKKDSYYLTNPHYSLYVQTE